METELIKMSLSQGIWAVLSVFLIFYILNRQEKRDLKQEEREKNYQIIIEKLTLSLNSIDEMKLTINAIKEKLFNK